MRSKLSYTAVEVRVDAVRDLCPSMRRVTLSGEGLRKAAPLCLDRRIKLVLPRYHGDALEDIPRIPGWYDALVSLPPSDQPPVRTYTARAM
ncbi:MAG: siderophore-interacting protein, partial [Dermabacter sp.]|nr:siderophore-interacting protein [Dermabacter sp.]